MTYAAACTDRLRLGCAVFVTPLHNPLHLAKAIGGLDQLSRGHVEVGSGPAGGAAVRRVRRRPDKPVARFNEGIALMKACWTEREITFDGRIWKLEGAAMEPKPVQKPHPPIWVGGSHPDAMRRAVRIGDGFFGAGSQTTAAFAEQVKIVRAELAERERDPSTFAIAKRVYIHVMTIRGVRGSGSPPPSPTTMVAAGSRRSPWPARRSVRGGTRGSRRPVPR